MENGKGHDSDTSDSSEAEMTWVQWFCSMRGNEFFCEVDEDYIQDDFNLYGLHNLVPNYEYALNVILDNEDDNQWRLTDEQHEVVERGAEMLYGLIHARFIITNRGLALMLEKYKNAEFGRCQRVYCAGQPLLPVGVSDLPSQNTVKLFCNRCQDIYIPKYSRHAALDGAFFGTSFPHLLLLQYPELVCRKPKLTYAPKIYGFKLYQGPPLDNDAVGQSNNKKNPVR